MADKKNTPEARKFMLIDEAPPTLTRKTSSVYREVVTTFIESDLNHAKVALPDHSAAQVYNGLRTAIRAVKEYGKRAKVTRRGDGDEMTVYLIRKGATE